MKKIFSVVCLSLLFAGCSKHVADSRKVMTVSIEPLEYIVDNIVGGDFDVQVLVPSGSSPETYEPTPRQIADVENSEIIFTTGLLGFESNIVKRVAMPSKIVDLSSGIELIADECGHGHAHDADPHIWTSPKRLRLMAASAYRAIADRYPDSVKYRIAYASLDSTICALDSVVEATIRRSDCHAFLVYHPAYSYFAADYGLRQLAVEHEGKEPSAEHLKSVISQSRALGIRRVLYQREFPQSVVEAIASELTVPSDEVDVLSPDVYKSTVDFVNLITR